MDRLAREPALKGYLLLPSVRGDLLHKLGRYEEALAAFEVATAVNGGYFADRRLRSWISKGPRRVIGVNSPSTNELPLEVDPCHTLRVPSIRFSP